MSEPPVSYRKQQEDVNAYFQSQPSFWKDVYAGNDVQGEIYRVRQAWALAWIDDLALAPGARVLEIGCGAGFMAIALAQGGLRVYAIDSTEAMVELARQHAAEAGTAELLSVDIGDSYALAFEDNSFDLLIALGVLPWLAQPKLAMQEMVRVTRPGGYILLTADNKIALHNLLEPLNNPALLPLRKGVKFGLKLLGIPFFLAKKEVMAKLVTYHSPGFVDKALVSVGFEKMRGRTVGFGPFSFFGLKVPAKLSMVLHHWLQHHAERNVPILRPSGAQYLVLARKRTSRPFEHLTNSEKSLSGTSNVP